MPSNSDNNSATFQTDSKLPTKDEMNNLMHLIINSLSEEFTSTDGTKFNATQIETALVTFGALAGFSTQMGIREKAIRTGRFKEADIFKIIETENGETYYTGEVFNTALFAFVDGHTSLFREAAGAVFHQGYSEFLKPSEIIEHTLKTLGTSDYGIPRVPSENTPKYKAIDILCDCWDPICCFLQIVDKGDSAIWPFIFTRITLSYIMATAGKINPAAILPLVLESAVAMAYVDYKLIEGKYGTSEKKTIDMTKTDMGKLLASSEYQTALKNAKLKEANQSH